MPGRTGARSSRASTATTSRKVSSTTPGVRASVESRASPAPVESVDTPSNALRIQICNVFRDAQHTTAAHRKLVVTLRKIHESCCYEPHNPKAVSAADEFDEEAFNHEFVRCVTKVMPIKKAESAGDKVIAFICLFIRHANEKDQELIGDDEIDENIMTETPSTRLISQLTEAVIPLMTVKDKFVRFRSTQLISLLVNSLDGIDVDLFAQLRRVLLRRIRDKEAMVRSQAVLGLGRLLEDETEDGNNSDDSENEDIGLREKLLEVLQNDPAADVRRTLLINLPITPKTLPFLLERARDQDALTRRAVYSRTLPRLGDFRHLSLNMREKLLRWGLRDRDENVRKAAGRLFRERWIEDCARDGAQEQEQEGGKDKDAAPAVSFEALLELLERIDVVSSGVENGIALEAMAGFWEGRPDYREAVTFDDHFWETLSAESVFMARSFNNFCRTEGNGRYESLLEEKLPEVTRLAFYLERYLNALIEALAHAQKAAEQGEEEEEDTVEQEFIVEQLLHIALSLDYSDEVGRRKMFTLLRQALSIPELPDEVTKLAIGVLHYICAPDAAGEREFCSVVLESVADVHDTIVDEQPQDDVEESFHSARSEVSGDTTPTKRGKSTELSEEDARAKAVREIVVNLKCLHIVQCMLEHVAGNLKDNADLVSMLNNLVVPAVRSHEKPVRERGLVCLGLCALLDKSLAEENLGLFIHFFSKGHPALQITALHILTDILNTHGAQLMSASPLLLKVYIKAVKSGNKAPEVQAASVVAASKLLLGRVITDEEACQELLKSLVVAYFDPSSRENQTVRQAMNYFLPVYCYSRPQNQDLMRIIALDTLHALYNLREGLEDEDVDVGEDMVSLSTIGACLVDWTDPRKCYNPNAPLDSEKGKAPNGDVHLDFAGDILDKLHSNANKEEKKLVASLLGKLYISPGSSEDKLRDIYSEISIAVEEGLLTDATSRNALLKIHVSLGKIVNTLDEAQQQQPFGTRSTRSVSTALHPTGNSSAAEEDEEVGLNDDTVTIVPRQGTREISPGEETDGTLEGDDTVMRD
ncbi:hypothetical protein NLU13_7292 [Sarocladium strictum]|uniref:Nuclear condensin complex subunit 3 C-terminal domain-containing protein n=1 Tax=Sarocladium strictum TaxID=5046 RepID=A0AA39L5N9_SARSR|nr:hypothetical protein NLU13_7292 [Sarocladium strictum]